MIKISQLSTHKYKHVHVRSARAPVEVPDDERPVVTGRHHDAERLADVQRRDDIIVAVETLSASRQLDVTRL